MSTPNRFNDTENKIIIDNYYSMKLSDINLLLPHLTYHQIKGRIAKLTKIGIIHNKINRCISDT